ncbi:hypothetical protein OC834_006266 [Tilletia horrida]|nr:hypothetical protein OC834_006266 [Tilletia horrida]
MADAYGSRAALRQRAASPEASGPTTAGRFQPGVHPIGFLSARKTFYGKKHFSSKLGFCCVFLAPPIIIIALIIALIPVVWAIGIHTLHTSQIHVYSANLTNIGNTSFPITLDGQVKKAGIFPAQAFFRESINVYWMTPPPNMEEKHLGAMNLSRLGIAAGHARLRQETTFEVRDEEAFGQFAQYLVSQETFTWKLNTSNVHVKAFGFLPTFKNLPFTKHVNFNGMANFTDIKILDFQLPGDAPEGGISLGVKTALTNPSPFGVEIGNLNLDLFYDGLYLGPGSASNLNITPGVNVIQLDGRLIPYTNNATALKQLGTLFTSYLNNEVIPAEARGVSTTQANGETISWLSRGIEALNIKVPIQAPQAIHPITGIDINYLSLIYNQSQPWSPDVSSQALQADLALPFGFSLDIVSTSNTITLAYQNSTIGTISGAFSNSSTHLNLVSAGQTTGTIDLTLPMSKLVLANDSAQAEQQLVIFQDAFTYSDGTGFDLQGSASALTNTPLGQVLLDGIQFTVPSGLRGLEGLNKYPTVITSVDVLNGFPDALELSVGTSLVNPSNLNLTVGNTTFQLWRDVLLGNVTLPELNLQIGTNNLTASSMFDPNRAPQGIDTLNRFISGQSTTLNITGFANSSDIISLAPTLQGIHLNASLPGLQEKLIKYANLSVLDTTGITNDIADGFVGLNNPFTSQLRVTNIRANVSSHGIHVADIDTSLNFPAAGKSVTGSPAIPILLNLNPPDIFALLRALAVQSGEDVSPLDAIIAIAGYQLAPVTDANTGPRPASKRSNEEELQNQPSFIREEENDLAHLLMDVRTNPGVLGELEEEQEEEKEAGLGRNEREAAAFEKRANQFTGFNLPSFVQKAFSVATANVEVDTEVYVGAYPTNLTISQLDVPLNTDASLNKLLPVLAGPIVQKLVDQAVLGIDSVIIKDPQETEFGTTLTGSITNAGPFDASISFPAGLTVQWQGRPLGVISLPSITLVGDVGGSINEDATFQVSDQGAIADFAKVLLTSESFVWDITAQNVSVTALGITIPGVSLTKTVTLRGFNGLQGAVSIDSYDLPSNDPAGGIHLDVQSTIRNPSQVGISLSRFGIQVFTNGVYLGPQAANQPFTLSPGAASPLSLSGRLIPQTTPEGQQTLSNLFSEVVHGGSPSLVVNGDYAGPESVTWLNEAIKVLSIPVSLPPRNFQVIDAITLNQFSLFFTQPTTWAPESASSLITAGFYLPFAFPIDITSVSGRFIDNYLNTDVGILDIPTTAASTDVSTRVISLAYNNIPLVVPGGAHSQFSQFIADATRQARINFNLHGTATASATTAAGPVTISGLDFSVGSSLAGVQNLNARPAVVSNLDVARGFPDYLLLTLTTTLYNPSNLTVGTGDVTFNTVYQGQVIGQVVINNLVLQPGENVVPTQLRFDPQGGAAIAAGRQVLENYVANLTSTVSVDGSRDSTPIDSLKEALAGISLNAAVPALNKLLIVSTTLTIPANIAQTSIADVTFTLDNPFTASINLYKVQATASYEGIVLGTINANLQTPISAPGHQEVTSQQLPFALTKNLNDLVKFILLAGQNTGTDLGPLPGLLGQLDGATTYSGKVTAGPDTGTNTCSSGNGFNINQAILSLLKGLRTDVSVNTELSLDAYRTALSFTQKGTPTKTDDTALRLIGLVAPPIVQKIVDGTQLSFSLANATNLTDEGFDVSLQGSVTDSGPFDAFIEFIDPLTVIWQGTPIATIALPGICAKANEGVPNYQSQGTLKITNEGRFADFATSILHTPSFTWTVTTDSLRVHALGLQFDNVNLTKSVTFSAFNNLPGVTIKDFTIPGQTDDQLKIATTSVIPSQASLGIELGNANFDVNFQGLDIGTVSAADLFLAPKTDTSVALNGFIDRQTSEDNLKKLGTLFSGFLAGKDQSLSIRGVSVISPAQPGSPVKWLTAAFKSLDLNVTLPGHQYNVITGISIADLTVDITGDPSNSYTIPASSTNTVATFANPFNFSLTPVQASTDIIIQYQGANTASLNLGNIDTAGAGTSTGPNDPGKLNLAFQNKDIVAIDRGSFDAFLAQLTDKASGTFVLGGTADVVGNTVVGNVPISGIPVNATTTLAGINSFGGEAPISKLDVASSTSDHINIDITVELNNPSNLTVKTKDVSLPSFYSGTEVGRTIIQSLDLQPGNNTVDAVFQYSPSAGNAAKASELLTKYLQPVDGNTGAQSATIDVHGYAGSNPPPTPYDSLVDALNGVSIKTTVKGLGARIVTGTFITLKMENLFRAPGGRPQASTTITAQNVLPIDITLTHIKSAVSAPDQGGTENTLVHIDTGLNFVIPASAATGQEGPSVTSAEISPVNVNAPILAADGGGQATDLLNGAINLANVITATLGGGYTIDALQYNENNVPAPFQLTYKGDVLATDQNAVLGATVGFFQAADIQQANDVLGYLDNATLANMQATDSIFNLFTSPAAEGTSCLCKATDIPFDVRMYWDPTCTTDPGTGATATNTTTIANSTMSSTTTTSASTSGTSASLPTTDATTSTAAGGESTPASTSSGAADSEGTTTAVKQTRTATAASQQPKETAASAKPASTSSKKESSGDRSGPSSTTASG